MIEQIPTHSHLHNGPSCPLSCDIDEPNNNKTSTEQELRMRISRLETIVLAQNAAIRYIIDKFYSGDALDYRIDCDSGDLDEIQSLIDELRNNKE